jgi:hypothetical protein
MGAGGQDWVVPHTRMRTRGDAAHSGRSNDQDTLLMGLLQQHSGLLLGHTLCNEGDLHRSSSQPTTARAQRWEARKQPQRMDGQGGRKTRGWDGMGGEGGVKGEGER